jgi:Fur family transcriptional regulator, peroxide stress response regulator
MTIEEIPKKLTEKGLKVTPQRIAVFEAVIKLKNHPTAENIIDYIRKAQPNIATATVYKVLDALVANDLIKKVQTEEEVMRYDALLERHHHLYSPESGRIEDYTDPELIGIIEQYFDKKRIPDFIVKDLKLQIIGEFLKDDIR